MNIIKKQREKYKHTRQLIKIAKNFGYTQKEIAEKCRTHQSMVSGWENGEIVALTDKIMPLIVEFGHLVESAEYHFYRDCNNNIFQVDGRLVFSHSVHGRVNGYIVKNIAIYRLRLHYNCRTNRFNLVIGKRFSVKNDSLSLRVERDVFIDRAYNHFLMFKNIGSNLNKRSLDDYKKLFSDNTGVIEELCEFSPCYRNDCNLEEFFCSRNFHGIWYSLKICLPDIEHIESFISSLFFIPEKNLIELIFLIKKALLRRNIINFSHNDNAL